MSLFAVSVRLDGGDDHAARWRSVVDAVRKEAASDVWQESAAFFLLESPKSARCLCDAIFSIADIYDDRDLVVVINLSLRRDASRGVVEEFALDT